VIIRQSVSITTNGSGVGSGRTAPLNGRLLAIIYAKPGSGGYDNGVVFAITSGTTLQALWSETGVNASKTVVPTISTHDTLGSAQATRDLVSLAADGGAGETIEIAVTSGGNAKTGSFQALVEV
jgi:hypothetical protein